MIATETRAVAAQLADAERRKTAPRAPSNWTAITPMATSPPPTTNASLRSSGRTRGATAQRKDRAPRQELRRTADDIDDAVVDAVTALHDAIAAHLHDDANMDEVRFLLRRLYSGFVVHDAP